MATANSNGNDNKQSKRGGSNRGGSNRGGSNRGSRGGSRGSTPTTSGARGDNLSMGQKKLDFTPSMTDSPELLAPRGESSRSVSVPIEFLRTVEMLKRQVEVLTGQNKLLITSHNTQQKKIVQLEQDLDDLQQYGRRENVCFSNLKFGDNAPVMQQVIELCDEINVTVTDTDFVDVHPLPTSNGRAKRVVARFKDRKLAQKVMAARKATKNMNPAKKSKLAADPNRGFGIQPNITPKRSALLAQTKAAVEKANLSGTWVDTRTGAILLRVREGERPRVIRDTRQIMDVVKSYVPNEFVFCLRDSDIIPDTCINERDIASILSGNRDY